MILRIHSSLCRRSYLVWIDTEMMKGSTMDGEYIQAFCRCLRSQGRC